MTVAVPRETALAAIYAERHLATTLVEGFMQALDFGDAALESQALRQGAGIVDASYLHKLDVQGPHALGAGANNAEIDRWRISERRALLTARSPFLLSDGGLSAIDVTDQFACFALAGPQSRDVLQRLAAIDLREDIFGVGRCVATIAGGIHTLVGRASGAFYLFVPRDAALSFWEAAQHAGAVPCGERAWADLHT